MNSKRYILNIGLARAGQDDLDADDVLMIMAFLDLTICSRAQVLMSDSEPTLVVDVMETAPYHRGGALETRIDRLARELDQDCIAVYDNLAGKGALIGPNASAWGEFNPAYFLLANGRRLSDGADEAYVAAYERAYGPY